MNKIITTVAIGSLVTAALAYQATPSSTASTKDEKAPLMLSFADLKWDELPERKGMQFATISGDPKAGEYTQMRKVPAGTNNPLHSHSSEIKNVIISGTWYTGSMRRRPRTLA